MPKKKASKKKVTRTKRKKRGRKRAGTSIHKKEYGKANELHPIYVKLDADEKLMIKKGYLSSQMDLLNLLKQIGRYRELRKKEMIYKIKLGREIKKIKQDLRELISSLPKTERIEAELEKTHFHEEHSQEFERLSEKVKLESELQNINRQLADISQ